MNVIDKCVSQFCIRFVIHKCHKTKFVTFFSDLKWPQILGVSIFRTKTPKNSPSPTNFPSSDCIATIQHMSADHLKMMCVRMIVWLLRMMYVCCWLCVCGGNGYSDVYLCNNKSNYVTKICVTPCSDKSIVYL